MNNKGKTRILVVDDEPDVRRLIQILMQDSGYEIIEAAAGRELLEKLETPPLPDLILLDVLMPGMNGYEACRKIKENKRLEKICVAMYSSLPEDELKIGAQKAGADAYITKNIDIFKLAKKIVSLLPAKQ